jgi:hypothetical protein
VRSSDDVVIGEQSVCGTNDEATPAAIADTDDGVDRERWAEVERVHHYAEKYAPELFKQTFADASKVVMRAKAGRPGRDEGNVANGHINSSTLSSNSRERTMRRLRRDRPDLAERVDAGELGKRVEEIETDLDDARQAVRAIKNSTTDKKDREQQRSVGRPEILYDNQKDVQEFAPTGNRTDAMLRRLRHAAEDPNRPDQRVAAIYQRVLAGEISAHAGMVEAGFRKRPPNLAISKRRQRLPALT